MHTSLSVNGERLWDSIMELAKIGATPKGGNCRLALSDLDRQGRDLLCQWLRDAGLTITIDKIGNIFARRAGRNPDLAPIATGSHIDTQPTGGKFDGCFGVLAGLEVMRTLQEKNIDTEAPLELIIWTNEEGARFVPVMMGSGVYCNVFTLETALSAQDTEGKTVREELTAIGYAGDYPVPGHALGAYIEAHIEQGPILEANHTTIGVVKGSLGLRWYDLTVTGMEAHAGPTPMELRQDALYAASYLMRAVIDIARDFAPAGRGTVGVVDVYPSSRNVIPGQVKFSVDLRHEDSTQLDLMESRLRDVCRQVAAGDHTQYATTVQLQEIQRFAPTPFDKHLINSVRAQAEAYGYSHQDILTGAGHDAVYVAAVHPTAMIFIPCKDGISHNEIEYASPEHVTAGANVLLGALLEQANARS